MCPATTVYRLPIKSFALKFKLPTISVCIGRLQFRIPIDGTIFEIILNTVKAVHSYSFFFAPRGNARSKTMGSGKRGASRSVPPCSTWVIVEITMRRRNLAEIIEIFIAIFSASFLF